MKEHQPLDTQPKVKADSTDLRAIEAVSEAWKSASLQKEFMVARALQFTRQKQIS